MYKHYSNYFYGNKVSDYGIEHGYVDYATLAKAFDAVLNNGIIERTYEIGYWEQESGFVDNSEEIEALQEEINGLEEHWKSLEYALQVVKEESEAVDVKKEIERIESVINSVRENITEFEERINELEEEQDCCPEIYQYYIVSDSGAEILKKIDEIVFYNEELDMYVWGVTHWGTSWDYVLTDIKICEYEN